MFKTQLFQYDSSKPNNKGTDYSKHLLLGDSFTDDLTEVLDVVDLTLSGLSFSQEFEPTTKFILERTEIINNEDGTTTEVPQDPLHLMVAEDLVSQPIISDDGYFDHNITFNEASVVAQNRLVDNISVTYRLNEVSLGGKNPILLDEKAKVNIENTTGRTVADTFGITKKSGILHMLINGREFVWKFPNWFPSGSPYNSTLEDWKNFNYYQSIPSGQDSITLTLPIPMLEVRNSVNGTSSFEHQGYCSIKVVVTEQNVDTGNIQTIQEFDVNPSNSNETESSWLRSWEFDYGYIDEEPPTGKGYILNKYKYKAGLVWNNYTEYYEKIANYDETPQNRFVTINAKPNCIYKIKAYLPNGSSGRINRAYEGYSTGFIYYDVYNSSHPTTVDDPSASISFRTYVETDSKKVVFKSAPIENAYELFNKAQLNTQNVIKQIGTPITETKQAFYLDKEYEAILQNTKIVENFYNQKNFWEILLDIGKYIHAIPKVMFGEDDRFVVTFRELGRTDIQPDYANKISIFNSKSIENYISACSSYVTNMVQLGGIIDEWVAPKSSSEDYLVYNDVAEIITSKNIIEIVNMEVKDTNTGVIRNLVGKGTNNENPNGYVFEENIYNILSINQQDETNKGNSIYYSLGSNKIQGLNYRLPTIHTGDPQGEYSIKKILASVFGIGDSLIKDIKVNDYLFHIVYRTKDSLRSQQTRPDLRKYLQNSKYDRVPQHYQFNNQTDLVIDSVKFGNNIYGKLIKTGNTKYISTEWNDSLLALKSAGELYTIRGERYYVSKATHTYYGNYIISEIEYSKDYNQLSEIIGIPSEPRFYEISEQSLIKREVPLDDYLMVTTEDTNVEEGLSFIRPKGLEYLNNLIFGNEEDFPKYAVSVFKNDQERKYGTVLGNENFYVDVCHPISAYSSQNTLTLEWDMVDNFSAGDAVDPIDQDVDSSSPSVDSAYNTLLPVRYVDAFGRSDLLDFIILKNFGQSSLTNSQIYNLPNSPIRTRFSDLTNYVGRLNVTYGTSTADKQAQITAFIEATTGVDIAIGDGGVIAEFSSLTNTTLYSLWVYKGNGEWSIYEIENPNEPAKPHISQYSNEYLFGNSPLENLGDNLHGLGLIKDNREQISLNYNIQTLTDSDRFVVSAYFWQPKVSGEKIPELKIALLNSEINKISNETISDSMIINNGIYDLTTQVVNDKIVIDIEGSLGGVDLTNVSAIAIVNMTKYEELIEGQKYFIMGRNIQTLGENEKPANSNWFIRRYSPSDFKVQ